MGYFTSLKTQLVFFCQRTNCWHHSSSTCLWLTSTSMHSLSFLQVAEIVSVVPNSKYQSLFFILWGNRGQIFRKHGEPAAGFLSGAADTYWRCPLPRVISHILTAQDSRWSCGPRGQSSTDGAGCIRDRKVQRVDPTICQTVILMRTTPRTWPLGRDRGYNIAGENQGKYYCERTLCSVWQNSVNSALQAGESEMVWWRQFVYIMMAEWYSQGEISASANINHNSHTWWWVYSLHKILTVWPFLQNEKNQAGTSTEKCFLYWAFKNCTSSWGLTIKHLFCEDVFRAIRTPLLALEQCRLIRNY